MKKLELFFLFVRVPVDYVALVLAALAAYFLRFETFADWRPATQIITFDEYVGLVAALALGWIIIFALTGIYTTNRRRILDELARAFTAVSTATMATIALFFFSREFFASRFIVLAAWVIAFAFVVIGRLLVRIVQQILFRAGVGVRRAVVVGSSKAADAIARELTDRHEAGYRIVGRFDGFTDATARELKTIRRKVGLDELIIADAQPTADERARALAFSDEEHVTVRYSADLFAARRAALDMVTIAGVPLVEIKKTPLEGWGRIYKRAFDVVVSFLLLVLTLPILLVVAIAVKLDSRGPIFYVRRRVGEHGKLFPFFKFRSMKVGAPEDLKERMKQSERPGIVPKISDESGWVTGVGRIIRRWSLDEIPQFVNVLLGHMSLVGPRPHLPDEVARYAPHQKKVLTIKPGITGLAQISGRADLSFDEEVALDTSYIERWSPKLDLSILLRTPLAVLRRKGAY